MQNVVSHGGGGGLRKSRFLKKCRFLTGGWWGSSIPASNSGLTLAADLKKYLY